MKDTLILLLPFAFGGNPAAASGPKCLGSKLKNLPYESFEVITIDQSYTESAEEYLTRVEQNFLSYIKSYKKIIILGGNHLSTLPIYRVMYSLDTNILTLDAHRDFYPHTDIDHATFLKQLISDTCRHLLIGIRDYENHSVVHPNISSCFAPTEIELDQHFEKIDYLDIDIDVIDPYSFKWCGAAIENGYSVLQVKKYISYAKQKSCKIFSISEYIPNWDINFEGTNIILELIALILAK